MTDPQGAISSNQFLRDVSGSDIRHKQLSTNALGQTKATFTNARGQTTQVVDALTGTLSYTYDVNSNLTQLNANGVQSSIGYDALDRKANNALESDTSWSYGTDASKHNVGQLKEVKDLTSGFIEVYGYDFLGRVSQTVTSLGQNGADGDYRQYATYDQYGRPFQQIDPTGKGVQYVYNAHGYTHKLVEASNPTHVCQQLNATNARGQTTSQSLHDGQFQLADSYNAQTGLVSTLTATSNYTINRTLLDISLTFDTAGNLTHRTRNVQTQGTSPVLPAKTLTEAFTYDQLNRLTAIAPSGSATQTMTYDLKGNITSKTGVGSYSYNPSRPHAVSAAGADTFVYDAIGNMTSGGGKAVTYNAFRKPITITKGTHSTSFDYGPDRSHYKRVDNTGVNITRTLTVGNVEFIKIDAGPTKTKRYIGSHIVVTDFNGTHEEHALLTDHLGSTVVMAKANSLETNQQDYDAFGKRRNLWTVAEELAAEKILQNKLTTTGFTGHEMLDEVGLIHMGGRVYDPNLGRFLSADPFITELDNTQNMNRYSYVYNNPLTLVDPSGFETWGPCIGYGSCVNSGFGETSETCGSQSPGCFTGMIGGNGVDSLFDDTCCFDNQTYYAPGTEPQDLNAIARELDKLGVPITVNTGVFSFPTGVESMIGFSQRDYIVLTIEEAKRAIEQAATESSNNPFLGDETFDATFSRVTGGLLVSDVIATYAARTGGDVLDRDVLEMLFTDREAAGALLYGNQTLHADLREILNANVPQTLDEALQTRGWSTVELLGSEFLGNLHHNPVSNVKLVGPGGYMEAIYDRETRNIVTVAEVRGSFNFQPSSVSTIGHLQADMLPYYKWGN